MYSSIVWADQRLWLMSSKREVVGSSPQKSQLRHTFYHHNKYVPEVDNILMESDVYVVENTLFISIG